MAALVILVNACTTALRQTGGLLTDAGHLVADALSFGAAKELVCSVSPDLLIADSRLADFTGFQLGAWARLHNPRLPIIITHTSPDPVLEDQTARLGAHLVVNPLADPNFLDLVTAALDDYRRASGRVRRWRRKKLLGPVQVEAASVRARVLDLSYGGMRLAFPAKHGALPSAFDVTLPTSGIAVKAYRVWTSRSRTTEDSWCGAEFAATGAAATNEWRDFVDSVS